MHEPVTARIFLCDFLIFQEPLTHKTHKTHETNETKVGTCWNMLEHVGTIQAGHSRPFGILLGWMILAGAQKYFRHWEHWPTVSAGPDEIQHVSSIQMHPACFKTFLSTVPRWFSQAALAPTLPTALSRPNRLVASSLAM